MQLVQAELEVLPERECTWLASVREQLAALAREPGGVCFRLWREVDVPGRFLQLETWSGTSNVSRRAEQHGASGARARTFGLLDMAWGRDSESFLRPGIYADHISAGVGPGKWDAWRLYARDFASVMVRQPGMIAHETLRCDADAERFVVLRVLVDREAARIGPEFEPSGEVELAAASGEAHQVYAGGPTPIYRSLELVAALWGPGGRTAYDRFMHALEPV